MDELLTLGMDVGSATSKCLLLRGGREIVAFAVANAGTGTSGPRRALEEALGKAGTDLESVAAVTATGYGRASFPGADYTVSELSCHALGARILVPETRTVIDIGGQDAKVLSLSPEGKLTGFLMNDKCAAGTGRFLEVMARVLEAEVPELAELDARAEGAVPISSTCTVFAESEVISQLAKGAGIPELVRGIHQSAAVRSAALARRLGVTEPVTMTGGVAQNAGVARALEKELGCPVRVPPLAQLAGALGAAYYGWEKARERA